MVTNKNSDMQSLSLEVLLTFSGSIRKNNLYSLTKKDDGWIAPWIIEKIKEMEKERKREYDQPRVYIDEEPLYEPPKKEVPEDEPGRGITIIDISGNDDSQGYNVL